ncbi:MAG TPA: long-chain fatty acid--CoA ligase, partial [Casimicrobiaceae bacterium]|nr:long-chain fatty acid--CoA ligase [Casimicrobiaceae bacterium]
GLMMDVPLTIPLIVRHAEALHGAKLVISRRPDRSVERLTYADVFGRARRLAGALHELGVRRGDRVATFSWNHHQHVETYFAVPCMGAVVHTLNIRLSADELTYIANHAGDSVVIVDRVLLPAFERFREKLTSVREVIVVGDDGASDSPPGVLDYEALVASGKPHSFDEPIDERDAAAMCYTSGTTGRPKGVVYSHRSQLLHTLVVSQPVCLGTAERDVVLPIVPMFHANAWGVPYAAALAGANQVHPGPHLDPRSLLELMSSEHVTSAMGVPTIWLGILQELDRNAASYDLTALEHVMIGGAAVPESLIRAFAERHGIAITQGWGMTETSPVGSISGLTSELEGADSATQYAYRARAGRPLPLVDVRVRDESGVRAWDDSGMAELEVRGPWIASSYYNAPDAGDRFTNDGWFKTGDIASIDPRGYIAIRDRAKDVIKSGGEWISSVALENAIMGLPGVAEAAVVGIAHPRWDERPLALVVPREGCVITADEIRAQLAPRFPKWWLPDAVELVSAIPKTSVGKFQKREIRERYRDRYTGLTVDGGPSTDIDPLTTVNGQPSTARQRA